MARRWARSSGGPAGLLEAVQWRDLDFTLGSLVIGLIKTGASRLIFVVVAP